MPQSRWTLDGFRLLLFIHFIARPAFLTKGGDGGLKITQTAKDENCPTSMFVTKDITCTALLDWKQAVNRAVLTALAQ